MKTITKSILILFIVFCLPNLAFAQELFKVGDKNEKIAIAQKNLIALGIKIDRTDGLFSKNTRNGIKSFQKKFKLKQTGTLDQQTYQAIIKAIQNKQTTTTSNKTINGILQTAAKYKGVPYKFGGTTPSAFDCSGYTMYVFKQNNVNLTRSADTQYKEGKFILKKDLKHGDLVFFQTYEKGASHVGIYAGQGNFWHASTSKGVMLSNLEESYWKSRYLGSRRIVN